MDEFKIKKIRDEVSYIYDHFFWVIDKEKEKLFQRLIEYKKLTIDKNTLSTIYFLMGFYYFKVSVDFTRCIKVLKMHQELCKEDKFIFDGECYYHHRKESGYPCCTSYEFLSECYLKIGKLEQGITAFENFIIRYNKYVELHGQEDEDFVICCMREFADNLKFAKTKTKKKFKPTW